MSDTSGGHRRTPRGSPEEDATQSEPPVSREAAARRDKGKDRELVGCVIAGKYRVLDVLGQGGYGSVFLVEMVGGILGDKLAMKILPREFSTDPTLRSLFLNEIRVAMKMVNPFIVQIRDVGVTAVPMADSTETAPIDLASDAAVESGGLLYYTMDYVAGQTLSTIRKQRGVLPPPFALKVAARVLTALTTAHAAGVIHRDLKPANIMIADAEGQDVKVLDFGIATAVNQVGDGVRRQRTFAGSPHYMPPEQFLGTEMGFYTDLYSVGVILYECLTGKKPYRGGTPQEIYNHLKTGPATPVDAIAPEVVNYPGLAELVMRAIERNPEKRFQSAREFYDAIVAVLRGEKAAVPAPVQAATVATSAAASTRPAASEAPEERGPTDGAPRPRRLRTRATKRSSAVPIVVAIVAVLLVGALAVVLLRPPGHDVSGGTAGVKEPARDTASPGGTGAVATTHSDDPARTITAEDRVPPPPSDTTGTAAPPKAEDPAKKRDAALRAAEVAFQAEAWKLAYDRANDVLAIEPQHARALTICATAEHRLGRFSDAVESLELLRTASSGSLEPEAELLLASSLLSLVPPDVAKAQPVLESLHAKTPSDAEVATLLGAVYEARDDRAALIALVVRCHRDGVSSERLTEWHRRLVVEPRERRQAELQELTREAVAAWSTGRLDEAAEKARSALQIDATPTLLFLLVEVETDRGRLAEADTHLARLEELAPSVPAETVVVDGVTGAELGPWVRLFEGRARCLRAMAESGKERDASFSEAETVLRRLSADGSAPDGVREFTAAYLATILAHRVDDPDELTRELRSPSRSTNAKVLLLEGRAFLLLAHRLDADPKTIADVREQELKEKIRLHQRLRRELRDFDADSDEAKSLQKRIDELEKEATALNAAHEGYKVAYDRELEALKQAISRLLSLSRVEPISRELEQTSLFELAIANTKRAELTGDATTLKNARGYFRRASETGLDTPAFHDAWGECHMLRPNYIEAAKSFETAYEKDPTIERCLLAADCYVRSYQSAQARAMVERGLMRFPASTRLRAKAKELED